MRPNNELCESHDTLAPSVKVKEDVTLSKLAINPCEQVLEVEVS